MTVLPSLVAKLTECHDAWIVGSAADPSVNLRAVRDFDVAVPFSNWKQAAQLIPSTATPNTFGGWKVVTKSGAVVDVWPSDMSSLFSSPLTRYFWHPRSGVRLGKL